jgi:transcriptional regulator with XRE-family HTH domain
VVTHTQQEWLRVAEAVKQARTGMDLNQEDLVEGSRVSVSLLQDFENANKLSYRELSVGRIERLFGWGPGSINAIAEGGKPLTVGEVLEEVAAGGFVVPPVDAAANEDAVLLNLPSGLTPRQREQARIAGEAAARAVADALLGGDDEDDVQPGRTPRT